MNRALAGADACFLDQFAEAGDVVLGQRGETLQVQTKTYRMQLIIIEILRSAVIGSLMSS